jgi:hypothetical protein
MQCRVVVCSYTFDYVGPNRLPSNVRLEQSRQAPQRICQRVPALFQDCCPQHAHAIRLHKRVCKRGVADEALQVVCCQLARGLGAARHAGNDGQTMTASRRS